MVAIRTTAHDYDKGIITKTYGTLSHSFQKGKVWNIIYGLNKIVAVPFAIAIYNTLLQLAALWQT